LKIIISGGSGQVGTLLARAFHTSNHEVVILGRTKKPAEESTPWRFELWDAKTLGPWTSELESADVVINLAGRTVNCRYNAKNQKEIMDSRVDSTKVIGQAIALAKNPPKLWLNSSTATIYAHRLDAPNDELTGIINSPKDTPAKWQFSHEVAKAWEHAVNEANTPQTRKVKLRSAMVMSPDSDGIFDTLLGLVRVGLGGKAASGKQYVSWIHETDFVNAIYWLIENETLEGNINFSAPNPLPYTEFMKALRNSWGMPFGLPATKWMLEIGTFLMRTETELVLKSRNVIPTRLVESGFKFQYPDWATASQELCNRYKNDRRNNRKNTRKNTRS